MEEMVPKHRDLAGQRFNHLLVLAFSHYDYVGKTQHKRSVWRCRCDCGRLCTATGNALVSGQKKSCGCIHIKENQIYSLGDVSIYIINGFKYNGYFWFDTADLSFVQKYNWTENAEGYAITSLRFEGKNYIHRFVRLLLNLSREDKRVVDHINGDVHDNRRCNLRVCSIQDNARHRYGVVGYSKTPYNKYAAYIYVDDKRIHLGNFATKEEALEARAIKEKELFREFSSYQDKYVFYLGNSNE